MKEVIIRQERTLTALQNELSVIKTILQDAAEFRLIPFRFKNLWGYSKLDKTIVISPSYDSAGLFRCGLAPVSQNGRYGFINHNNVIIIRYGFSTVSEFRSEGVAYAFDDEEKEHCVINIKGEIVYKDTGNYRFISKENYVIVFYFGEIRRCNYGLLNKSGHLLLDCEYDYIQFLESSRDYFLVHKNSEKGIYSEAKGWMLPLLEIEQLEWFNDSFILISLDRKMLKVFNYDLNVILEVNNVDSYFYDRFSKLIAVGKIIKEDGEYFTPEYTFGLYDCNGELIIPFDTYCSEYIDYALSDGKYSGLLDNRSLFQDNRLPVKKNNKYGYIDLSGTLVIEPIFDYANEFSESFAVVGLKGKTGFINRAGEMVILPLYFMVSEFSSGLAWVRPTYDEEYICIDVNNEQKFELNVEDYEKFINNVCIVKVNGRWGVIDSTGSTVIPFEYEENDIEVMEYCNLIITEDEKGTGFIYDIKGNLLAIAPQRLHDIFIDRNEKVIIIREDNIDLLYNFKGDLLYMADEINEFDDGIALVKVNNKMGYINSKGIEYWVD